MPDRFQSWQDMVMDTSCQWPCRCFWQPNKTFCSLDCLCVWSWKDESSHQRSAPKQSMHSASINIRLFSSKKAKSTHQTNAYYQEDADGKPATSINTGTTIVSTPLKNMSLGLILPNIWKKKVHVPNHQPPSRTCKHRRIVLCIVSSIAHH